MLLTESPLIFKIICSVISLLLIGGLVFFLFKTKWFKFIFWYDFIEFFTIKIYGSKKSKRKFNKIIKKMVKIKDSESIKYNKLISQCDDIMDFMLKNLVPIYQATDFTERLRVTGLKTFTYPKLLWEAHTYTNNYIKNNQVILTREQAQNILNIYYYALKNLEVV